MDGFPSALGKVLGSPIARSARTTGVDQLTLITAQLPAVVGGQNQAITNIQPSLTLTYLIAINGIFPSNGGSEDGAPYLGQVFLSANPNAVNNPPQGFLPAQGQLMSIAQNRCTVCHHRHDLRRKWHQHLRPA